MSKGDARGGRAGEEIIEDVRPDVGRLWVVDEGLFVISKRWANKVWRRGIGSQWLREAT